MALSLAEVELFVFLFVIKYFLNCCCSIDCCCSIHVDDKNLYLLSCLQMDRYWDNRHS